MKERVIPNGLLNKSYYKSIPICGKCSRNHGMLSKSIINEPILISNIPYGCYRNIKRNSPYHGTIEVVTPSIKERSKISIRLIDKVMMII